MDTEIKKYVDFLMDSAESLTQKIKTVLPENYEKIEVIYFVDYVMCDLLQTIDLPNDQHWQIVNEYLRIRLFNWGVETITTVSNPDEHIAFLNEKSIVRADRMNEFKNSTPLMVGIAVENDKIIQNLVNRASNYICLNKNEVMSFGEGLFLMLKEHSQNHIEDLHKLAGWKKFTSIFDIMISQEKNIQKWIRDQIIDKPIELELYYYSYYLVYSFYEREDIFNQNTLTNYSSKSLDNIIRSINGNVEMDEILNKRNERFEKYEGMWNQIDYLGKSHFSDEKSSNISMFYGFASKYIYGKNLNMMTLMIIHPYILEVLSTGAETYYNAVIKESNPSILYKVKSFFK